MVIKRLFLAMLCLAMLPLLPAIALAEAGPHGHTLDEEHYVVEIYHDGAEAQIDQEMVNEFISQYVKDTYKTNTDIRINFINWGLYEEKLNPMLAAGEKVDIVWCSDGWGLDWKVHIPQGDFIDWTPYLDQVPEYTGMIGDLIDLCKFPGKDGVKRAYLVPTMKEFSRYYGIFYNATIADELGLDFSGVTKLADLEPIMAKYIEAYPNGIAFVPTDGGQFQHANPRTGDEFAGGFAPAYSNEKDEYVWMQKDEGWLEIFHLMQKWYADGYFSDSVLTLQTGDFLNSPNYLIYPAMLKPGFAAERNPSYAQYGFQIGTVDYMTQPIRTVGAVRGNPYALSRTSENPERAAYIYQLICTDPVLTNAINYGIEGVHYEKISDKQIRFIEEKKSDYFVNLPWQIGNVLLRYTVEGEQEDLMQQYAEMEAIAIVPNNDGFDYYWTEERKAELLAEGLDVDLIKNTVIDLQTEFEKRVMCGMITDEELATANKILEDMNYEWYIQDINDQYAAWKAENGK